MFVKKYEQKGEIILAACDEELIGKTFTEGELILEVNRDFYMGEVKSLDDLDELIQNASIVNLTGNEVVNKAIDKGFIDEDNVLNIDGIKHAQLVVL